MINKYSYTIFGFALLVILLPSCAPTLQVKEENNSTPEAYQESKDSVNTATLSWKEFFSDTLLTQLIDTALKNNQELNIIMQEINISKNEIGARKGEYLPFVSLQAGAGAEKVGRYTRDGAVEDNLNIAEDKAFPEPLPDFFVGFNFSWEIDIWKKLRNAKKAAALRYLSSIEGKNFMVSNLVAEIAHSYYELMALDNQLQILQQNISIQKDALKIVKLQKKSAKVTELAVRKFEAEVLKNQSYQFIIQQSIIEAENKINFLLGRFPQEIKRNSPNFNNYNINDIHEGIPSQLLSNRTDIKQAELNLEAAKLDVKVAKAKFYPTLDITSNIGIQAFNVKYLLTSPESILYNIAGDLLAPLINRKAIKANYLNANAKQIQAIYEYEKTILNAFIEVSNQVSKVDNLKKNYDLKEKQVEALSQSINIASNLFKSARADYMEVLLTQRDALEAKMELIDTKIEQMNTKVNVYKSLGGGWK